MFMVRGDGISVSEVYMLNVTCYSVGGLVGLCAECIPYVSSLADCWFGFMCVCLVFIDGDLLPYGHFMFFHDVDLIIC